MSKEDLIPLNQRTKDEQKEIQIKGGIASGVARKEKKMLSKAYADMLMKKHKVIIVDKDGRREPGYKSGEQIIIDAAIDILLNRKGSLSSAVSMMKEIREATEGSKISISDAPIDIEDDPEMERIKKELAAQKKKRKSE